MTLLIIVTIVLAFHVAIVYAITTRHFNALFLIAGAFAVLSPLSTASDLNTEPFKQARVYCTMLIVALGFLAYRLFRIGPVSAIFTAFIAYYWIAAMWSDFPMTGILYKGLFGALFLSGVLLAHSVNSLNDLRAGLRVLSLAGVVFAAFILLELVRNPAAFTHVGRLMVQGINPNFIGQTAAGLFIISCFLALYDKSRNWRVYGYIVGATLLIIILYTGSRGSFGMALIGAFMLGLPLTRRPGMLFLTAVFVGVVMYFGLGLIAEHARERLFTLPEEVRAGTRESAMRDFYQAPIFGNGWVFNRDSLGNAVGTKNQHNIYLQVLSEVGVVGMLLFASILAFVGYKVHEAWRYLTRSQEGTAFAYLMVGMLFAVLAHGFVESSTIMGTTVNALLFGFSVALIDRLPVLLWQREYELEAAYLDDSSWSDESFADDSHESMPLHPRPLYNEGWGQATEYE